MTLELLPGPWQKNQSAAQCARMFQTIVKPVYVCYILFIYLYIYSDSNQQIKLLKLILSEFSVRGEPKSHPLVSHSHSLRPRPRFRDIPLSLELRRSFQQDGLRVTGLFRMLLELIFTLLLKNITHTDTRTRSPLLGLLSEPKSCKNHIRDVQKTHYQMRKYSIQSNNQLFLMSLVPCLAWVCSPQADPGKPRRRETC